MTEAISSEQPAAFSKWQKTCRKADPNATFSGSITMGAQAVNWINPGNKVVGDWDGKTMTGTVNK